MSHLTGDGNLRDAARIDPSGLEVPRRHDTMNYYVTERRALRGVSGL